MNTNITFMSSIFFHLQWWDQSGIQSGMQSGEQSRKQSDTNPGPIRDPDWLSGFNLGPIWDSIWEGGIPDLSYTESEHFVSQKDLQPSHSTDHAVWKAYFFGISMLSVIGLQMSKNQMPLSRGSMVLNLWENSFFNPLAFIILALWPSKLAKWQGPTRSMGYVLDCY